VHITTEEHFGRGAQGVDFRAEFEGREECPEVDRGKRIIKETADNVHSEQYTTETLETWKATPVLISQGVYRDWQY